MRKFGLIGFPLGHSFSKKYFTEKFEKEGISGCQYDLYEIPSADKLKSILEENSELEGVNVTIPYKQDVIPMMSELDPACEIIGAVNCIKVLDGKLKGYNTDYIGFKESLTAWLGNTKVKALVLGTGGASKAVVQALRDLEIEFLYVSRAPGANQISYQQIQDDFTILEEYKLIINCTPLGTYPKVEGIPDLPVDQFTAEHWVYDLVYNPPTTALMQACLDRGGKAKNGLEMLILQAEAAWEIWNE
jgi:shikimate dehydrogenase